MGSALSCCNPDMEGLREHVSWAALDTVELDHGVEHILILKISELHSLYASLSIARLQFRLLRVREHE